MRELVRERGYAKEKTIESFLAAGYKKEQVMELLLGIALKTLGSSEWLFGALLLAGFWNKKLGILGALGACGTFIATSTIIPFFPEGWAASAGGFPAMTEHVAFLMKDLVL